MRILVFRLDGEDAILASLRRSFPSIGFRKCRADENIDDEGRRLIVMDTIPSVKRVMLLESLDSGFLNGDASHAVSMLRILKNLSSIDSAKVIAVPESMGAAIAVKAISAIITDLKAGR
jgi:hypothetical protein